LAVEEFFIITNVLTPNGDEINDYVWITNSLPEIIEAKMFNRWGLLVWQGVGNYLRFSGKTTGGADLKASTYYHVVGLNYGEAGVKSYITPVRE
jgi:gliding motility-associated-like protein